MIANFLQVRHLFLQNEGAMRQLGQQEEGVQERQKELISTKLNLLQTKGEVHILKRDLARKEEQLKELFLERSGSELRHQEEVTRLHSYVSMTVFLIFVMWY